MTAPLRLRGAPGRAYVRSLFSKEELHAKATRWADLAHKLVDREASVAEAEEWLVLDRLLRPFQPGQRIRHLITYLLVKRHALKLAGRDP